MSDIEDLSYDIEQLYIDGLNPKAIARELGCPLRTVELWLKNNGMLAGKNDKAPADY